MSKLSDAFDLQMGKTPARVKSEYWSETGNKWVSIADLSNCDKYVVQTKEFITDLAVKESGIKPIPPNTVIMSFKLSLGKTAITTEEVYSNEAIMSFIPNGKYQVLPDYFYYLLSSINWDKGTNRAVMGATLNKATLSEFSIDIPPIETQKQIAKTLDKVTDLINKRKQQLEKLDELVKSRFVEMFGDPITNPMEWDRMTFKQASLRLSDGPFGSNLKSEHYTESGIRVIRLGNIGVSEFIDKDKSYISNTHYEKLKKYTCRTGEIVIGTLGEPNLRACCIPKYIDIAVNKADCVHFIPNDKILSVTFACQYINCPQTLLLASSMVHGQTRTRISSGQIAELPIYLPPLELQTQFANFVESVDRSKQHVKESLEKLETLKKSLMQEYFG